MKQRVCLMRKGFALPALLLLLSAQAWAGDAVKVDLQARGTLGKDFPSLSLRIVEPIAGFWLKLERNDGKKLDVKGGGAPGVTRTIDLPQPEGKAKWKGELQVNFPRHGESGTLPLDFETELWGPLKLNLKPKDVDTAARKVTFTANHPLVKVHLRVVMDTGWEAADRDLPLKSEPAGTPQVVSWPASKGQVATVELRAHDTGGFFSDVELSLWRQDVPHPEVAFDARRWELPDAEKPKVDAVFQQLDEAIKAHARLTSLKLFIVGHTDSVGLPEKNRRLSLNRAMSLGLYLRRKGLALPLFCEGVGEEALLVPTPDETAEPRNHRIEYILSLEGPELEGVSTPPRWRPL